MKINIVVTEAGKIVAKDTIIKLDVNPFDMEGSKIPISMFQNKGDILVGKGISNPATINVGSDGQVLVSDSSVDTGVKWKTMQLGTITLSNSETFAIISGTVVTQGTVSGTFRIATSADTTNLYVASEDILPSEDGVLYATSGVSCNVRVTDAAVAIGDKLAVSSIDGVAQTTTETHFAIAVTGKSAGEVGKVNCILVNQNVSTLDVPGGGTGRPTLTANSVLVGNGVDPIKLIPTHKGVLYASYEGVEPTFGTLPIAQGGTGATTDVNLFRNKNLNTINIDTEYNYNYAVAVSEVGHGTRPADVWILVANFYTNHFIVQIAQEISNSTVSHESGRTWVRERYIGSTATWSTWKLLTTNKNTTITLAAASWSNKQYTYTLNGVKADSIVFADPADSSRNNYFAYDVWLSSNSTNKLVFKCAVTPTVNLNVKIVYTI